MLWGNITTTVEIACANLSNTYKNDGGNVMKDTYTY